MATELLEQATQHFLDGKYEEALAEFEQALQQVPPDQHAVVHANRGAAMMSVGDVEGAVAAFDQALAVDADHLEALHNKGVALSELERYPEALQCFDKVCDKMPEFYAGQCGRSETLAYLGKYAEAVEAAEKATKIEPDNPVAHCDKAFALLKLKKFKEAAGAYAEATRCGDDSAETKRLYSIALSQHALECEEQGDRDNAEKLLLKSCEMHPNPQNYHNRGIILLGLSRRDDAVASFHAAVKEDDSYFESHAALGALYAQVDKLPESTEHLSKACALDPKSVETRYNLGVVRIKGGDVQGARSEWLRVLEIEPGEPHATEALRILDAALAEAKAKGSDGKAETQAAAQKISDMSPATASAAAPAAEPMPKVHLDASGRAAGMSEADADKLIAKLDSLDAALASASAEAAAASGGGGGRRKSVLERPAQHPTAEPQDRSFVRDVSAAPQLRKAAPRDNFGGLEAKLTSALSKLEVDPGLIERRKSYSLGPRAPGTVLPERPKVTYKEPGGDNVFSYQELKNKIPDGVDPSRKEEYLSPEEFKKVFGKTKEEFTAFPAWKKIREKKRLGLF